MKQKTKKNHITPIDHHHDDDDDDDDDDHSRAVPGSAVSRKALHRRGSSLNLTPRLSGKASLNMNSSSIGNGGGGNGKSPDLSLFGLRKTGSVASDGMATYDAMSMSMSLEPDHGDHQMAVSSMQKQLELNQQYNGLLERTINSLRHSHNVYTLHKQWIEIRRELKPLPAFTSLTDLQHKRYVERTEHLRQKEEMRTKRTRKSKQRATKSTTSDLKAAFAFSPSP